METLNLSESYPKKDIQKRNHTSILLLAMMLLVAGVLLFLLPPAIQSLIGMRFGSVWAVFPLYVLCIFSSLSANIRHTRLPEVLYQRNVSCVHPNGWHLFRHFYHNIVR